MRIALQKQRTGQIIVLENKRELWDYYLLCLGNTDIKCSPRSTIAEIIDDLPYAEYSRVEVPKNREDW